MFKQLLTLALILSATFALQAQRYLEEIFDEVEVQADQVYATNFDVSVNRVIPLTADVYQPVGDSETSRPAVMIAHSGSFFPRIFNGSPTGAKDDSVIVEVATRLAQRGYVVFAYTYRQGWQPSATIDDVRKGSLLQAAYRGIQDTRSLVRYIRRSVDEQGNRFGVDPSRIAAWGIGTGGYLSYGTATLDDFAEVTLPKFRDGNFTPYIDTTVIGNVDGTTLGLVGTDTVSFINNPGYSSDVQMAVNMGGALGDASWIDGTDGLNEPPMVGFHCTSDVFAPYYLGNVLVPVVNFIALDDASGTRQAIQLANERGSNDVLATLEPANDPLGNIIQSFKNINIDIDNVNIPVGTDNFYPFTGFSAPEGSPWDWWSLPVLEARVQFINDTFNQNYDANVIHQQALATNPDMSAEKARRYIDTIFMVAGPRLCVGLGLGCEFSSVSQIDAQEVNFQLAPNPARGAVTLTSASDQAIEEVRIFSTDGQLLQRQDQINSSSCQLPLDGLPSGMYMVAARFADGIVIEKLMVN